MLRADLCRPRLSPQSIELWSRPWISTIYAPALTPTLDGCACRKPKPGMILEAAAEHGVNVASSYMVGDRWRDVEAGLAAGCHTVFIDRHYAERRPSQSSFSCQTLTEAARFISKHYVAHASTISPE